MLKKPSPLFVLIEEEKQTELKIRAIKERTTVASIVRELVDNYLKK